ncbi:MAG TPA: hypothetical protein VM346_00265 [Sphingomicrobium sp.]|nr:hypothetical protein [Sphingomicrobium sp.]
MNWGPATVLGLTATAVASGAAPQALPERCPGLSAADRAAIEQAEKDRTIYAELIWYSRENCVSLAEARRRMDIQLRDSIGPETEPGGPPPAPPDSIGGLSRALEQKEAATFAGMWIEHQPAYRVVVAFARDAAATLRQYTSDPLFVPLERPGPTQAELRATRERVSRELDRLGARPSMSSSDSKTGRVEIAVLGDLGPFRAAVARGEVDLPPYVDIREPGPLRFAAPPLPPDWQTIVKAFPRQKLRSGGPIPDILRTGTVVLEGGCLRLKGERQSRVIVWPNEAALDLVSQPGTVRIVNRMSGKSIEAGKRVDLGGNSGELAADTEIIDTDPACPGPYFRIGNFGPLEPIEQAEIEGLATAFQQQRNMPRAQALRLAREEKAREERFYELGQRLLREAPESYAGVYSYQGRATIKFSRDPQAEFRRLVPADLRPFAKAERVPRPLAALQAERKAFLDEVERLAISATAYEDIELGRIVIAADDLRLLARAAAAGQVSFPAGAAIQSSGAMPERAHSENGLETLNRRLEAVPDWAEMRSLVEATNVPGFLVTYKKEEPDRPPTRGQSLEITRFLVSAGYTAEDLKALHAEGLFPARAYVEQNGRATPANRALLAREVVIAEVLEVRPELLGDGYRTTVRLRVAEGLKGDLQPGDEALVRFISGPGADGKFHQPNFEPALLAGLPDAMQPGSRWLMFLSEGMLAREAALVGKATTASISGTKVMVPIYGAWPIKGGDIGATYAEPLPGSLAAVRALLKPIDAAFDRASRKRGVPLQRRVVP